MVKLRIPEIVKPQRSGNKFKSEWRTADSAVTVLKVKWAERASVKWANDKLTVTVAVGHSVQHFHLHSTPCTACAAPRIAQCKSVTGTTSMCV